MSSEGETKLERAILPVCASLEVDVVDVEFRPGTLLITVERSDGLDLDLVAQVARAISDLLDADDSLGPDGHFELEVSSPGLERRLRRPQHFQAAIGSRVALRTTAGTPGERRVDGTVVSADGQVVEICEASTGSSRRLAYDEIERARTVVDWQAALRDGKERTKRERVTMS